MKKHDTAAATLGNAVDSEYGWVIQFHQAYDGFNVGEILYLDEAGLSIYYCSVRKVATRIA